MLLLGLAGSGLVLLAMRQGWAHVTTEAPAPLPAGSATVTGQQLVPAADALAVAALASLAAVLATRRLLRRITGLLLAGLGAGIAVAVSAGISAAAVTGAVASAGGLSSGSAPGSGPGSVTSGGIGSGTGAPLAGFAGHPVLATFPWRAAAVAGALLIVAAGLVVTWWSERLPVMSSRYERQSGPAGQAAMAAVPDAPDGSARPAAGTGSQAPASEVAALWESLSRGEDPTGQVTPER